MSEIDLNTEPRPAQTPEHSPVPAPSAPEFAAATQPSYARTLFLDSTGLRPGWGLVCYGVLYFALRQISSWLAYSTAFGTLRAAFVDECGLFLAATIPAVALARIEHRPWGCYGLAVRRAFGPLFWRGTLWGFSAISLLMVALYEFHVFDFGHVVLHGARLAKFGGFWAAMFLAVGLYEEFFFRGYSQFTLTRGIGFWPAALVLSSAFGLIHLGNPGEQWQGALAAAAIGLFFCLTLRRTGNLWFAVGFHAAWDWGESFFYSVPDSGMKSPGHLLSSSLRGREWLSGGAVGPEGSLLCFVVLAATWIVFDRIYPKSAVPADHH
jgi:membrane protease YdiL (CAAX protease family)